MSMKSLALVALALAALSGCSRDTTRDSGVDSGSLADLKAGIWLDPNGCDHWIIDDGFEGYMSPRLTPDGIPVCSGADAADTKDGEG